ncbi:MAG: helix-turn-helix domain-containing protein [Chloroflexi bacterium]|nr:helix-turn-helix domain-containing protein [Chloroflexota bacterium]
MTARHQLRVGGRRIGRDRVAPFDATPAPALGEMLRVARERKGVDLYRVERDTKIRARHLDALESGDYAALPSAVYIKGFLRNYAVYLGLDPDETLARWRSETVTMRRTEAVTVAPPRPLAAPRRGPTFTPGLIVSALLSVLVIAFLGYVAMQVMRFSQSAEVTVDGSLVRTLEPDAVSTVLAGTTAASATVTITGPSDFHATTDAGPEGTWSMTVPLTKGRNDFGITAADPGTDRASETVNVIVTVPVPVPTASAAAPTQALPATTLTVAAPAEGASLSEAVVSVSGTTSGTSVVIAAEQQDTSEGTPASPPPSSAPEPSASPDGSPQPAEGAAPEPLEVSVTDGSFSAELPLSAGAWSITVTSSASGRTDTVETRTIEIALEGVEVVVEAVGGKAYIQAWVDGEPTVARILRQGQTLTFTGEETVLVRTGSAGATHFTVDGEELGVLGGLGEVENWLFEVGEPPRRSL